LTGVSPGIRMCALSSEEQVTRRRFMRWAFVILALSFMEFDGQANVPAIPKPEVVTISPALKKAVEDVQKQCPTCATVDIRNGKQTWLTPPQTAGAQIDAPDGCTLTQWTHDASQELRAALERALTPAELDQFHQKEPKNCDRKAFGYYLEVTKRLLPKSGAL
jgi:hypothetical protein